MTYYGTMREGLLELNSIISGRRVEMKDIVARAIGPYGKMQVCPRGKMRRRRTSRIRMRVVHGGRARHAEKAKGVGPAAIY